MRPTLRMRAENPDEDILGHSACFRNLEDRKNAGRILPLRFVV